MIDIGKISSKYEAKVLNEDNTDEILGIFKGNPQFFKYSDAHPTKEQVYHDMHLLPSGMDVSDKYYFGLYNGPDLVAIMDIIDGFPTENIAYLGFFMMNQKYQGQHVGSAIINEAARYLKGIGKNIIRLVIDKSNPQSTHFWSRNGFVVFREAERNGHILMEADRVL
ncbi:MAG: GNAT family N-acetyltransferase [Clostridiales bacterium]|nr:GNAT family N-acetyltransferase [Clostridiales bacterium]